MIIVLFGWCALVSKPAAEGSKVRLTPSDTLAAPSRQAPATTATPTPIDTTHNSPTDTTGSASTDSVGAAKVTRTALNDTVSYSADKIEYDIYSKTLLLTKNGMVKYKNMVLYADTIHYVVSKSIFIATGLPQLIDGADTVIGSSMVYNIQSRRGRVHYASAHSNDTRYNGEYISKSDSNVYYMENAEYSSCAVIDSPHYSFYGKNIKVLPGNKAITRPVVLNIGNAPVAALPFFVLPLEHGRQSGILRPSWGGHPGSGGYMDNIGYYWAPNDYTDFTLASEIREFKYFVISAEAQYRIKYLLDVDGNLGGRYTLSTDKDKLSKQWAINYSHRQPLLPDQSLMLSGTGNLASSSSFYRTFSEDTSELLNQKITATLSLSKQFKKLNASMNLAWLRDQNLKQERVDENLPSFSFNLPTRPLIPFKNEEETGSADTANEPKWYNKIQYSYAAQGLVKRRFSTLDSLKDDKFIHGGLQNNLSLSYNHTIFKWFNLSPSFTGQLSVFDATVDTNAVFSTREVTKRCTTMTYNPHTDSIIDSVSAALKGGYDLIRDTTLTTTVYDTIAGIAVPPPSWSAGVSLSTNIYGLFPINAFTLNGIRHTLTPSLSYTFTPKRELDKKYPDVVSYAGAQKQAQTVSFSVNNLFQGKTQKAGPKKDDPPKENKFTIISGPNISASYNFEADMRKLSDISVNMSNPNPIAGVGLSMRYTPYDEKNQLLLPPKLMEYSVQLSPKVLAAKGSFWGGDLLVLDKLLKSDSSSTSMNNAQSWSASVSPSYSFSRARQTTTSEFVTTKTYQLSTQAQIAFSSMWSLSWSGRYDFTRSKFESNTVYFNCDLECWDMRFEWSPSGYNPGFRFNVGIKKHPDIKWEHSNPRRRYGDLGG
jgi:hypothetical protein